MKKSFVRTVLQCASLAVLTSLCACTGENVVESSVDEVILPLEPLRVGPVSQYGQLMAGKPDGVGRIYGSCEGPVSGKEVQVRGMSLYWNIKTDALAFYTERAINTMVKEMKVEVIRFAEATTENWGDGFVGYMQDPEYGQQLLKQVIDAAIRNDIYVIIDWHSHTAENQEEEAAEFFEYVAKTYGHLDNIIFELYNEPKGTWGIDAANTYWPEIKSYADKMISIIRQYSDNLIVVGNPFYSQYPNVALDNPINDNNVAYTFHYYANSHKVESEGKNADAAMKAGYSVFITEWGTGNADGTGVPGSTANSKWQKWIDANKLSWANWSASRINEGTAAFDPASTSSNLIYTRSGTLVKSYLRTNPDSYIKCGAK